ncbi:hypothetical protein ACFYVR_17790 [Rhodococcus sp. NPDC003318]|uniref:hypothetical protein n=1 Tax=Rhodococcus sp. NPDC003318 TaxID=3364503 RepID=UPI00367DBF3A
MTGFLVLVLVGGALAVGFAGFLQWSRRAAEPAWKPCRINAFRPEPPRGSDSVPDRDDARIAADLAVLRGRAPHH